MLKKLTALLTAVAAFSAISIWAPDFSLSVGDTPVAQKLTVQARDLKLVCPGALYKSGGANGMTLGAFAQVGTVGYQNSFNPQGTATLASAAGVFTVADSAGGEVQGSALLDASQLQSAQGDTLKGLAATNCQLPSNDIWLVGGDTTTGRESLLILRNSSQVDSTVDLTIYSEGGRVDAPGLSGIAVIAGEATVVPLSSIIPKTKSFATHVSVKGGALSGWIQQRTLRGLRPGGVDYIGPSIAASTDQVIPGLLVRATEELSKFTQRIEYQDMQPVVRLFVPGKSSATVTVQVFGATAKTFGTVVRANVAAESVVDLELTGLQNGDYIIVVTADQPVMATSRLTRLLPGGSPDFTWLKAAEQFTGARNIAVPATGISKISSYDVETGAITINSVAAGSTYRFAAGENPIVATLVVDVDGAIANLSVLDQKFAGGKVAVNVR
jgi:hypothetical protein